MGDDVYRSADYARRDFYHDTPWRRLIQRYADGRKACNCGDAYYSNGGKYWKNGIEYNDGEYCKDGCAANLTTAKYELAKKIEKDLLAYE